MRFDENAMNWIGATVGDLVGTVGAILSLKDTKVAIPFTFAADNNSFEKSLFVPGLQNLQNNCFLNVVLQVIWLRCLLLFSSFFNCQMNILCYFFVAGSSQLFLLSEFSSQCDWRVRE